jgi:hypothetical protein
MDAQYRSRFFFAENRGLYGSLTGVMRSSRKLSRLEDAEFDGHSLVMLLRIASALDKRVEIRFVSM